MIRLEGISFRYAYQKGDEVLTDISLDIQEGEFLLLTGESGCGKTTLTRILNGLCPKFYEGQLQGDYFLSGKDTAEMTLSEIGGVVGSVFQDPRSQFFCMNTTDEIVFPMENMGFHRRDMKRRLEELGDILPLEKLMNRNLFQLSSGEKQMVALASVCSTKPRVLVFDEPSANLDATATHQLAQLLAKLKKQGHTIIVSEHRIHYLKNLFDRILILKEGRIAHIYTEREALSLKEQEMIKFGLRLFEQPEPLLSSLPSASKNAVYVEATSIQKREGTRQLLENISVSFAPGKVVAITGSNGAGKTTLLKILTGIMSETGGLVSFGGNPVKRKKRITSSFFVQQDADYQLYSATVNDEVMLGIKHTCENIKKRSRYFEYLQLTAFEKRHPASLSGGQKQRVLLAAAAIGNRPFLVFDEPTSGLDGRNMRRTANMLRTLAREGHCVVLVTHDMELIGLAAEQLIYMKEGKIIYQNTLSPTLSEGIIK